MGRRAIGAIAMPMKPTRALKYEIYWCKVRDQQIEVYVEALLDDLCADDKQTVGALRPTTLRAELVFNTLFEFVTMLGKHPGMKQKSGQIRRQPCDRLARRLGAIHGVADPACTSSMTELAD
jgi:hypothetical protein